MRTKPTKEREPVYLERLIWSPGHGPDPALLEQLKRVFGKPQLPLGEAWFLGETRFFHEKLNASGMDGLTEDEIDYAFEDVSGGLWSFPEMEPWSEWFGYFLPRLLSSPKFATESWYGALCSALLGLSIRGSQHRVSQYEADFATVLASWVMQSRFWDNGRYKPLQGETVWRDSWGVSGVDGGASTALLFSWRYLHPQAIREWLHSVIAIEDYYWRAHFITWLADVSPIFEHGQSNYPVLVECNMEELWIEFYRCMISLKHHKELADWNLIEPTNIDALRTAIREEFDQKTYFNWIDLFSADDKLWPQMETRLEQMQGWFFE